MQVIIPMTGYGSRFVAAGYKDLKPLIDVQGRRILEWIVKGMYSPEEEFVFVCRQEHLDRYSWLGNYLKSLAPRAQIFPIKDWIKLGPVYDVLQASEYIVDDEPCIINYCDFYMEWDWKQFKHDVWYRQCDGCIPCYSGFHPNLLPKKNVYASCLTNDQEELVEIREKFSFDPDKTKSKHSPGVYYFRNGGILKKYCQKLVDAKIMVNGEFYASLPFNLMVQDGLKVWVPVNVKYFCQWGTPEDLEEYLFWTNHCRRFVK